MDLISRTMKDTLKTLELLDEHIDRIAEQGIYEIERDLLLERLRSLYATVIATEAIAEEERVLDALAGLGVAAAHEVEPEVEIERLLAEEDPLRVAHEEPFDGEMYGCPAEEFEELPTEEVDDLTPSEEIELVEENEPEVEEVVEEEPTTEQIVMEEESTPEPEPIVVAEEPAEEASEESEISEELDHEAVMSLYDDDDEEEEEPEPQVEEPKVYESEPEEDIEEIIEEVEEPAEAEEEAPAEDPQSAPQSVVLGDVLATEQPTLADNLAEQVVDVATASSANLSLRQSIAINDKFILLRDLFGGNNDYYETAIDCLDSFDNLDEAMLYIYDNFHWNPNSEGARLLMELLARKLF